MSWQASAHVLKVAKDRPELSPNEVLVLLLLSVRHNADHGAAWPDLAKMATECHLSKRTVERVLNALEQREVVWIATYTRENGKRGLRFGFAGLDEPQGERVKIGGRRASETDDSVSSISARTDDRVTSISDDRVSSLDGETDDTGDRRQMTPVQITDDTGARSPSLNGIVTKNSQKEQSVGDAPDGARAAGEDKPKRRTLIDEPFIGRMVEVYKDLGESWVRETVAVAVAYPSFRKWPDSQAYVQRWLRKDAVTERGLREREQSRQRWAGRASPSSAGLAAGLSTPVRPAQSEYAHLVIQLPAAVGGH